MRCTTCLTLAAIVFAGSSELHCVAQQTTGDPCTMVSIKDVGPLLTLDQAEITARPMDPSDPHRMQCVWQAENSFGTGGELDIHLYTFSTHALALDDLRTTAPFDYQKKAPLVKTTDPDDYVETTAGDEVLAVHGPYKVELNISGVTDAARAHPTWEYRLQRTALLAAGATIAPAPGLPPDPVLPQREAPSKSVQEEAQKSGSDTPWYFNATSFLPFLAPIIIVLFLYRAIYLPRRRRARLQQIGLPGTATVDSISDTGVTINGNPQVRYHCTVTPASGSAPYKASTTMLMNRLDRPFAAGTVLQVKIDPGNPQSFIFA
jgi:hypothetical protein